MLMVKSTRGGYFLIQTTKVRPSRSRAGLYRGFPKLSLFSKKSANFATNCELRRVCCFLFDWKCLNRATDHTGDFELAGGVLVDYFFYFLFCVPQY